MSEIFQSPHADPDRLSKEFDLLSDDSLREVVDHVLPTILASWPEGADDLGTTFLDQTYVLPNGRPVKARLLLTRTPRFANIASEANPRGIEYASVEISEQSRDSRLAGGLYYVALQDEETSKGLDATPFNYVDVWKLRIYEMIIVDDNVAFDEATHYQLGVGDHVLWDSRPFAPNKINKAAAEILHLNKLVSPTMTRRHAKTLKRVVASLHRDLLAGDLK